MVRKTFRTCKNRRTCRKKLYKLSNFSTVYGEVTREGIEKLIKIFNRIQPILKYPRERRTFYDLGSGFGKNVIVAAELIPSIKSKGIELVKERHDGAIDAYNKLSPLLQSQINFTNGSMFDYDISDAAWIFISNLCFSNDINVELALKIEKETKPNTIVACSKPLTLHSFTTLPSVTIPMTWNSNSELHFYKKN